ncbi:hypothetical protein SADUNF_Sadunf03G0040400 [Salix dunnii]|uniref:PB1 domain-containing protein n=1 Tax=Salix dunnii TaxID=1413687 RepID=A0A835KDA2_9ROSI|nr:hypothetical protein SADUNF_Sadunf03G0040400 [Salix dunnii]
MTSLRSRSLGSLVVTRRAAESGCGVNFPSWPVFTEKVYKRGALGRSIHMARYSGSAELKQDLARRFGIEGQLEDQQRIGWKLVYMDHDDDVLLVGEDPWE